MDVGRTEEIMGRRRTISTLCHKSGRKIICIGNDGSAEIASHQGGMRAIAFNNNSLLTCISNDCGYPLGFEKPIEMFADPGVLVVISSSGRSESMLRGNKAALSRGYELITMSGFKPDNPFRSMGRRA
jgi:D-sedoheptulose 7-phosphate isomerase